MRDFYQMIPKWAVEKHAWLGAGLILRCVGKVSPDTVAITPHCPVEGHGCQRTVYSVSGEKNMVVQKPTQAQTANLSDVCKLESL